MTYFPGKQQVDEYYCCVITKSSQTARQPLCVALFCPVAQREVGIPLIQQVLGTGGQLAALVPRPDRSTQRGWAGWWAAPTGPTSSSHGDVQGKRLGSAEQAHTLPGHRWERVHHLLQAPSITSLPSCLCRALTVTGLSFSLLSEVFVEPFAKG